MSKPDKLICGMTEPTARRYIIIRKEMDIMIERIHKAGHWLSEFDKVRSEGLCQTLSMMGVVVMHAIAVIHDYLENEFASKDAVRDGLNKPE